MWHAERQSLTSARDQSAPSVSQSLHISHRTRLRPRQQLTQHISCRWAAAASTRRCLAHHVLRSSCCRCRTIPSTCLSSADSRRLPSTLGLSRTMPSVAVRAPTSAPPRRIATRGGTLAALLHIRRSRCATPIAHRGCMEHRACQALLYQQQGIGFCHPSLLRDLSSATCPQAARSDPLARPNPAHLGWKRVRGTLRTLPLRGPMGRQPHGSRWRTAHTLTSESKHG